jgi:hypothetical protein
MPNNPTWIEPPPDKEGGLGCFGKGCLLFVALGLIAILLIGLGSYFFVSHGVVAAEPTSIPVEELSPDALTDVKQRVEQFRATSPSPRPTIAPSAPNETPTPAPSASAGSERQLTVTSGEINGLISANKKSRGHAYVSLSGNTATVQVSIPTDKMPGLPHGYLNGSFNITTNGPTPLTGLKVSRIEANGYAVPSGILSWSYRGQSMMGYALDAVAPYNVSTVEIQDGKVIAR